MTNDKTTAHPFGEGFDPDDPTTWPGAARVGSSLCYRFHDGRAYYADIKGNARGIVAGIARFDRDYYAPLTVEQARKAVPMPDVDRQRPEWAVDGAVLLVRRGGMSYVFRVDGDALQWQDDNDCGNWGAVDLLASYVRDGGWRVRRLDDDLAAWALGEETGQ